MSVEESSLRMTQLELLAFLIRHFDIHQGRYALLVDFQIAGGRVGPAPDQTLPGVMIGVAGVGIVAVDGPAPNTLDAAECNPPRRQRARQKAKTTTPG